MKHAFERVVSHSSGGLVKEGLALEGNSCTRMVCRQLVSIRRPELLEPDLFPASAAGGLPISAGTPHNKTRRRSWASSDYLADRLNYFS